jgi:hypothetical protein
MVFQGEEYVFRPDWGEQLEGKHQSVVIVCDIKSETLSVLEGIPDHLSPGQVIWTPDGKGIVGVAWENRAPRLGLIYCTNRPSHIFHLTVDGDFSEYGSSNSHVRWGPLSVTTAWRVLGLRMEGSCKYIEYMFSECPRFLTAH